MAKPNASSIQVARIAFSAADALEKIGARLSLRAKGGDRTVPVGAKLAEYYDHELSHGRTTPMTRPTALGEEHERLLAELEDLGRRLEAFATKVLTQGE